MPSSKGKPTDPSLREKVKNDVMKMDKGGGAGNWSAWKAGELARQYEAKGGGYEDTGDNPNSAQKGAPKPKKSAVESGERKSKDAPVGEKKAPTKKKTATSKDDGAKKTKSSAQKKTKEPAKGDREQPKRSKKK